MKVKCAMLALVLMSNARKLNPKSAKQLAGREESAAPWEYTLNEEYVVESHTPLEFLR